MKWLKLFAIGIFLILVMHTKAQNNETGTVREAVKDYINKDPKYKISSDI